MLIDLDSILTDFVEYYISITHHMALRDAHTWSSYLSIINETPCVDTLARGSATLMYISVLLEI